MNHVAHHDNGVLNAGHLALMFQLPAKNARNAAVAKAQEINTIGQALRANPEYLMQMKWETIKAVGAVPGNLIITDGNTGNTDAYAAARRLENRLKSAEK